jgi:hypothetical protein
MKAKHRYDWILDDCLNRILNQGISLEDAIAGYPEHQERLRADLDTAAWFQRAGSQLEPRPGFVSSSRRYLVSKIEEIASGKSRTVKVRAQRDIFQARWVLAALLILVVAWGSLAVGMDRALPGNPLYRVKTAAQDFRLFLTVDAEAEARLHRQYAQDALIACAMATSEGRQDDARLALWNYERHMAGMSRSVQAISPGYYDRGSGLELDAGRIYLQDIEILKLLVPGSF